MKIKIFASLILLIGIVGFFSMNSSASSQDGAKSTGINFTIADNPIDWEKMDHDARKAYMKQTVLPAMRAEFSKFDPKTFSNMNCKTCHGDGVKDDSYKMPNPKIFKLPNSREGWAKADTSYMRFMKTVVKPKMAELLGMHQFDMKTKTGFGCGNCHTDQE